MNSHKNARLTVHGRALLLQRALEEGLRPVEAAQAIGVSTRTVYKCLRRFREEGPEGLQDCASRPTRCPHRTPPALTRQVLARRRQRQTYRRIAEALNIGLSTVARLVKAAGLHRLSRLDPPRPHHRYEHDAPGDMLHLDIKRLGRFRRPGHRAAIDDYSRIAFATIHPDETARSACRALLKAVHHDPGLGTASGNSSPTMAVPTARVLFSACVAVWG